MQQRTGAALTKRAVVDAALTVVDREGLSALTIRKLAAELSAPPMSLYTHFKGKEQLHDLMFDRLMQRLFPSHEGRTWQQELSVLGHHARAELLAHPHWLPLLTRADAVPVSSLAAYDHLLRLMSEDGFSRGAAMHAFSSALGFALGAVLTERMMTPHRDVVVPLRRIALLKKAIATLPRGSYPNIAATNEALGAWSFDAVFELGLRSLIKGIEVTFVPSRPKAKKPRRSA